MNTIYQCGNCERQGTRGHFTTIQKVLMRLLPGDTYTDLECPACGALALPVPTAPPRSAPASGPVIEHQLPADTTQHDLATLELRYDIDLVPIKKGETPARFMAIPLTPGRREALKTLLAGAAA
jgi:hypothetical protein